MYELCSINNKLSFIDSFQLRSLFDCLVKKSSKHDFEYLSQEFDNNILDLVKQKGFCLSEYMCDFGTFEEKLQGKERFYNYLTGKKVIDKDYEHVLK